MKKWYLVSVLAAVALVGCKSKEERQLELVEEYANLLDANKDDCGKAAKAASDWEKAHASELKDSKEAKPADSAAAKALEEKYKDRIGKAMEKLMGVGLKCADNADFKKAMDDYSKDTK